MEKYEFVTIKVKNNVVKDAVLSEHRAVINEYASIGYSYAGYIPVRLGPSGKVNELDLIFQAEA